MKPLVAEHIRHVLPYPPGKPIRETRRELGLPDDVEVIKLASNENPHGPSPRALAAARDALAEVHLYPDGGAWALKQRLKDHLGVGFDELITGNGSNEVLDLLLRTFLASGEKMVMAAHAFVIPSLICQAMPREVITVPARHLGHDLEAMAAAARADDAVKVVYVANPNNPTGTWNGGRELRAFLRAVPHDVIPVIDEAYLEYVVSPDYEDGVAVRALHPLTVVLRTFSKGYGLAGLRCGYAVAPAEMVALMNRLREPFNVSTIAQAAAAAALDDHAHVEHTRRDNREQMARLEHELRGFALDVTGSQANFLLVHTGRDGRVVFDALLRHGVIVRPMAGYGLPEAVRITVGTAHQNDRLLEALRAVLG